MSTANFTAGQRWISDTEPDLGLGTLIRQEGRTLTLMFLASGEKRTYARDNAPLTRVRFQAGDKIESHEGWQLTVAQVEEQDGLLRYHGADASGQKQVLSEGELSHFIQFNRPHERLFAGQIDPPHWYELRLHSHLRRQQLEQSDLIGLGGARTELLPHQLYIAHEVGKRLAPRVLLADEVGLGKTIEACLILHTQLLTGRATRALIVVPDSLLHQWLVELKRRFNLSFSLFDEERCQAAEQSNQGDNPFLSAQLVLCGLGLITGKRFAQAFNGEWDMLIVDEAHHLEWHESKPSAAYQAIEALAGATPGVLLLTATPEQLGRSAHFARLRLLDPDRYYSLEAFRKEEAQYQPIAEAARLLVAGQPLDQAQQNLLRELLDNEEADQLLKQLSSADQQAADAEHIRQILIDQLLDRHGTGRGLFRNTRDRIKGFKPRRLHEYPLHLPDPYLAATQQTPDAEQCLYPERLYADPSQPPWWQFDPRVDWLINKVRSLRGEKLLLICAHDQTALELEQGLRQREGISAALFHAGMNLIERDRAAAWFADPEQHCPLMICSEIGSEGRNFQFAHQLVLFDLPNNPDLLEQRIGRLDRIGQRRQVELHLPHFASGAQQVLYRWYHEGLNAFVHTCPSGQQILAQLRPALIEALETADSDPETLEALITSTRQLHAEVSTRLSQGRDHLLELNSCRELEAETLQQRLKAQDDAIYLDEYMEQLFDAYGVEHEYHSEHSLVLRPGAQMQTEHFPGLASDGMTITYDRDTALVHEDRQFLTWEHPMVRGAMAMLIESEQGNNSVVAMRHPTVASGTLAIELLFILECSAPRLLQASRFLPPTLLRLVVDQQLRDRTEQLDQSAVTANQQPLQRNVAKQIALPLRGRIQAMIDQGQSLVIPRQKLIVEQALARMQEQLDQEIARLKDLQRVNLNIKPEEIDLLSRQKLALEHHLQASRIRLDAIRLLVGL